MNLVFILWVLFGRGDDGSNAYGPAPAPNTRALVIVAWLIPIAMLAAAPGYSKLENDVARKVSGGTPVGNNDFQARMEAAAAAAEAKADAIEGVGNQTGTEAAPDAAPEAAPEAASEAGKEQAAPAEPKAAN